MFVFNLPDSRSDKQPGALGSFEDDTLAIQNRNLHHTPARQDSCHVPANGQSQRLNPRMRLKNGIQLTEKF